MKSTKLARIFTASVLIAIFGNLLRAQETAQKYHPKPKPNRYTFVDLGTLGGPVTYGTDDQIHVHLLNDSGVVSASSDTSIPDPNGPDFCWNLDCFLSHAFRWKEGVMTDLGALPGTNVSEGGGINSHGWSVGLSENGLIDPLLGARELRAVLWKDGQILDLGTLGGNQSIAGNLNNRGQVVGFAANAILDSFSLFGWGTQTRAFLWQGAVMQDLGTLGGPDAMALMVNERGQVTGISYTNATPNPETGPPATDPFLWDHGRMIDLGTLGGNFGAPNWLNNHGQVAGLSNLAGDLTSHPFLWDRGVLTDLGTLGGDNGSAIFINDVGDVVGEADLPGSETAHAFLWRRGVMTDLGTLGTNSVADDVNSRGQVVGASQLANRTEPPFRHAFLSENGGPMIDLNTLIPANSGLELVHAFNINERGEIAVIGVPGRCFPDFCGHIFLLIPCRANDTSECEENDEGANAEVQTNLAPSVDSITISPQRRPSSKDRVAAWRAQMAKRYQIRRREASRD